MLIAFVTTANSPLGKELSAMFTKLINDSTDFFNEEHGKAFHAYFRPELLSF